MKFLTIITPTYNRGNLLNKVYDSLLKQTNKNFIWLVIDDGSSDDTRNVIDKFINDSKINIQYIYKQNGGKHTALNVAFKNLNTELATILDSDDVLTNDAVETIDSYNVKYKNDNTLCGFCFLKGYSNNKSVTSYPDDENKANYNDYIINSGISGDKCEVFKSSMLEKYSFDEFKDEKFLAEGYLWSQISEKHDMVFINKIIYICEYLEDGLTKSGRTLRLKNPLGGKRHAEEYLNKKYNIKVRFKNALLYIVYAKQSKTKIEFKKARILLIIAYVPALLLKFYWNKKYMK